MIDTTVIIVGGGPAGAACAWQLQRHNIPYLLLDKAAFPRVKPCAGWITPEVFTTLELSPNDYPHGLTTLSSFMVSLGGFKFRLPTHQYAIRRVEFDAWLLERAGVDVQQHQVQNIEIESDHYVIDDQFSARFIVGAGGTHCPVRRSLFADHTSNRPGSLIITKEEEFLYAYKDDRCHLWFFEDGLPGYAWYVPKADGYLNVGIGGSAERLRARGKSLNVYWTRLVDQLDRSGLVTGHDFNPLGYSYYLRGKAPLIRLENAFLVGDALGLATRDMGEGISAAIHSGLLAADAIIQNRPYEISTIPLYSLPSLLHLRRSAG